jgi:hypothetical protein
MSVLSSEQSQKKIGQVVLGLVKPWAWPAEDFTLH